MKPPSFALFGLALLAPCVAAAEDSPGADALAHKAEACIREHAAEVVRFSPTMADSVTFLVDDLCSRPIEAYRNFRQSESTLALYRDNGLAEEMEDVDAPPSHQRTAQLRRRAAEAKAQVEAITIDPDTGELRIPPGHRSDLGATIMVTSGIAVSRDARFRTVAAEAILAARSSAAPKH